MRQRYHAAARLIPHHLKAYVSKSLTHLHPQISHGLGKLRHRSIKTLDHFGVLFDD
jgi:hypothetical protein